MILVLVPLALPVAVELALESELAVVVLDCACVHGAEINRLLSTMIFKTVFS